MDPSEPTCNCRIAGSVRSAALNRCQRHGFDPVEALYTRAHAAEEEAKSLREGLRYLGYAMRDGDCRRIRDRWGGNTPEDWCGEADALHGLLERLHAAERDWEVATENWRQASAELAGVTSCLEAAERRAAVLAALLGCAGECCRRTSQAWMDFYGEPGTELNRPGVSEFDHLLDLLATNPHELMRLVPETTAIIAHALGAAGLGLEDLDVLEEN